MMNATDKASRWSYAAILPILLIAVTAFSLESYTVPNDNPEPAGIAASPADTLKYPPIPDELIGKDVDTVFFFDPKTMEEVVVYKERITEGEPSSVLNPETLGVGDTLVLFDPQTFEETVIVRNPETGLLDTLGTN